jgi:hypothetical protein
MEAVRLRWRSYDAVLRMSTPATVPSESDGPPATLEIYESADDDGVRRGSALDELVEAPHGESFNHVARIWTASGASTGADPDCPYVGKSTVGRGEDQGEAGAAPPLGVHDLQLYPPPNDHLVVVAFVVPVGGEYRVSDLGARRVSTAGDTIRYEVFAPTRAREATLLAGRDGAWVRDPEQHRLGHLRPGDRIYFGVNRDGDDRSDATQISFSVALLRS